MGIFEGVEAGTVLTKKVAGGALLFCLLCGLCCTTVLIHSVNCNDVTVCNFVICVVHSISSCLLLAQLCYVPVKCVMCYVIALIACLTCSLPM